MPTPLRLTVAQEDEVYRRWIAGESLRSLGRAFDTDFHTAKRAMLRARARVSDHNLQTSAEVSLQRQHGASENHPQTSDTVSPQTQQTKQAAAKQVLDQAVLAQLRKQPRTVAEIAEATGNTQGVVLDWLIDSQRRGANLHEIGGKWSLETTQPLAVGPVLDYVSRPDNTYVFGAMGDTHLGSKYERLDVLNRLYDRYAEEGVDRVFHTGNWIDGEARFNKFDLHIHGMGAQVAYLAEHYPQRPGLTTYAVAGDDHEGWYCQREGVDIGRLAEHAFRDQGRDDWINLGYMEAILHLTNANTGKKATLAVVHPGGGSAYALSYSIQKIVECVPLDTEILTRQGWKRYDQIDVGEEVLGYDIAADRCEWTTVERINVGRGDVVRYHNDQFDVRCTPNHKWAIEWESRGGPNPASKVPSLYSRRERLMQPFAETKHRSRVIQAAPSVDGPGMPQVPHQSWLRRDDTVATVMAMTSGERRAFIEGMLVGEGTICNTRGYRTIVFSQRPGPVNDGFRLACFLEGIATSDKPTPSGSYKPTGEPFRRVTLLNKRMRNVASLRTEHLGEQDVWCPTTGLGTWVMRQGDLITITGNSYEGGEKPSVGLYGHYHKLWSGNIRNVWTVQTGTCQDQTPFMRKKRLEAHVGGTLIKLRQDPETGAITECTVTILRYFNRSYYNDRWSHSGKITLPTRS